MAWIALVLGLAATGCSQIAGIEEWQDPILSGPTGTGGGGGGGGGLGGGTGAGGSGGRECQPPSEGGPTCADCIVNGLETDLDCGGDSCAPCENGQQCGNDADCSSHHCLEGICGDAPPPECQESEGGATCADCILNGLETDVDCGGDSCAPCPTGMVCATAGDCDSGTCDAGHCM